MHGRILLLGRGNTHNCFKFLVDIDIHVLDHTKQARWNTEKAKICEVVELGFTNLISNWLFLDFKASMMTYQSPIVKYCIVASFLCNLRLCRVHVNTNFSVNWSLALKIFREQRSSCYTCKLDFYSNYAVASSHSTIITSIRTSLLRRIITRTMLLLMQEFHKFLLELQLRYLHFIAGHGDKLRLLQFSAVTNCFKILSSARTS
jgi:hypothetical protein